MKVKTNTKAGSALWAAKLRASQTIQNKKSRQEIPKKGATQ